MKIKFFTFIVAITLIVGNFNCIAASKRWKDMPVADIAIGSITLGVDESYVRRIYGNPNNISYTSDSRRAGPINTKTFTYGTTFFIVFDADSNTVWEVKSTGNNGLKTPVGFTVGMNLSDVSDYYGKGRGDENHLAYSANWHNIMFTGNSNGKITEIRIYATP